MTLAQWIDTHPEDRELVEAAVAGFVNDVVTVAVHFTGDEWYLRGRTMDAFCEYLKRREPPPLPMLSRVVAYICHMEQFKRTHGIRLTPEQARARDAAFRISDAIARVERIYPDCTKE